MGYMRHHAIVVTTFQPKAAEAARAKAIELFEDGLVSETLESVINGYLTFLIAPDGSKLGWARDKQGDESRDLAAGPAHEVIYDRQRAQGRQHARQVGLGQPDSADAVYQVGEDVGYGIEQQHG